jgi:L-lactate dehydrogenase complex protein LldG
MGEPAGRHLEPLGESRGAMLGRIRRALGRGEGVDVEVLSPPAVDEALVRVCSSDADLVERFLEQAHLVGMQARRVQPDEIVSVLADLLRRAEAEIAAIDAVDAGVRDWARAAKAETKRAVLDADADDAPARRFAAPVAITDVEAAIADTGSLVLSSHGRSRACHLLPEVHIAIVRESQILADLVDFWRTRPLDCNAAATVVITGPSKTADIEGVLITGVHGPAEVHILVVAETEGST